MQTEGLLKALREVVGRRHVKTQPSRTAFYRSGFRCGLGDALAVVFPGNLLEQWRVLQACVDAGCAIIMQATKTGLTGGSTPHGSDYDRPVVIINIARIKKIMLLRGGAQVIALPGSTLYELERVLEPVGRVPHSVIGSTTIGATIVGGIANNAGGALCKRGCSYTRLALFARVNRGGELELVNHLGIDNLGSTPEEILTRLEAEEFRPEDVVAWDQPASDRAYKDRIRDMDAELPNRYNTDPKRLFDVSGSAGKVAAFAVRVDTCLRPESRKVYFLGANRHEHFVTLRRKILGEFENLPEMCEYMNRGVFDTARRYGKDVILSIKYLGTKRLPRAYALKSSLEHRLNKISFLPRYLPDIMLYWMSRCIPQRVPKRLLAFRDRFEHYLILVMSGDGIEEARQYLETEWGHDEDVDYFECTEKEQSEALLLRFAAAGAGVRYQNIHQRKTEEILALDVALRGNDPNWLIDIPEEIEEQLVLALHCGHYMCHVAHYDYIFRKGTDISSVKKYILDRLDERGARYPAEHNVGHMYEADETLRRFYEELDPTNTFNPGIGKTSKHRQEPVGNV